MNDYRDFILQFVILYRDQSVLWDQSNKNYANRNMRSAAYEILLQFYKTRHPEATRSTLVKKINSLRVNFRKEWNKVKAMSMTAGAEPYEPRLFYYNEMLFLVDHTVPDETWSALSDDMEDNTEFQQENDDDYAVYQEEERPEEKPNVTDPPVTASYLQEASPMLEQSVAGSDIVGRITGAVEKVLDRLTRQDDDNLIIARSYALKLNRMNAQQRMFADKVINEVLLEGQLGNLTRTSHVVPMAMHPAQSSSYSPSFSHYPQNKAHYSNK